MLLNLHTKNIKHNIQKICFFAVPQDGSGLANIPSKIAFRNNKLKALCKDSSYLEEMNDLWSYAKLNERFDILSVIAGKDAIVNSNSAKSIFRDLHASTNVEVETNTDAGHMDITKPKDGNDLSFILLRDFIKKKKTLKRYRNNASRDLDDWKSIERNHGYHYVSDEKRNDDFSSLITAIEQNQSIVRLTGASGLGKTRLLLEAIDKASSVDDDSVLMFDAVDHVEAIKESVRKVVDDNVHGLIIIENCSIDLHNALVKEINKKDCQLRIVTIGYSHDQVDKSIHIQLSPLSDEAVKELLTPILVDLEASDVERVARFAQGYPLMATLIAEQYQKEGKLLGSIAENSIVRKLIDGDGGGGDAEKDVLSACSLFDVFGTGSAEGFAGIEAKFIAEQVANSTLAIFDKAMKIFSKRQIINRAGKYARLVPKPLALTLASEWWDEASYERQKELIDNLPDSLMQSFCIQASYLDSLPSVQRFSEKLFGGQSPFVTAEELLTERGSKLFRAFVEVNPESTSSALYNLLTKMIHKELLCIDGDIRRNLIWGLEKLCFHAHVFEESAWCMLLLASAENESWSNNATGMFAQLFRVNLSGTGADPKIRFGVLRKAFEVGQLEIDMVVLEALGQAISTYGGTRTVGAEYQGTKAPLEEWHPKIYQDIYDFWQEAFDLLLCLLERGDEQKEKVLGSIGHSIRGFVSRSRIEMLDSAIKQVVKINGRYWPAALESIKHTFSYDSEGLNEQAINALNSWLDLLNPDDADLSEKLKIVVINPPWEHHKGKDGHYIDDAAVNAKGLATEVAKNIELLFPNIGLLLQGEQKQTYSFGYQLALELDNAIDLLDISFEKILVVEPANTNFILGIYRGVFEKSSETWQECIDRLLSDERLIVFYPEFIRTGDIKKSHLDTLLDMIRKGAVSENSANVLSYGSVTDGIEPQIIAGFCLSLAELGDKEAWSALNVIFMFCFGSKDSTEIIREPLKILVTTVLLHKDQKETATDIYHWHDMAQKILLVRDDDFAVALVNQIISASRHGFNHGDLWSYINPLLTELMSDYGDVLWPIFSNAIVNAGGRERYWFKQLLEHGRGFSNTQKPSVLSVLPVEKVIEWCIEQPNLGPNFVASCVNIFEKDEEQRIPSDLFIALLEKFGDDDRVTSALNSNISSRGWSGSLVPYLEDDKTALSPLLEHASMNVRRWVKDHIAYIHKQIEYESARDAEEGLGVY